MSGPLVLDLTLTAINITAISFAAFAATLMDTLFYPFLARMFAYGIGILPFI